VPFALPAGPARFGIVYAALYLGTGIATPYIPVWFRSEGLSGPEIGIVLAVPMLARVATAPIVAWWADRFALRRTAPAILAGVAAIALGLLLVADGFAATLFLWFAANTALGSASPLIDVVVLRRARREKFAYAIPRGIGSAAYVIANIATGFMLLRHGPQIAVIGAAAAALLSVLAIHRLIPADAVHDREAAAIQSAAHRSRLLSSPDFLLLLLSGGLIQGANAYYYGFSALLWQAQGIGSDTIGLLWGVGVACEVAFLWFLDPFRRALGPERMLMVAGAASVLRCFMLSLSPPLALLWPLQALHALTLSAAFVASLQLAERHSPARDASAAQQLNAAIGTGLVMGIGTLAGGPMYAVAGPSGYLAMATMAALGSFGAWLLLRRLRGRRHAECPY